MGMMPGGIIELQSASPNRIPPVTQAQRLSAPGSKRRAPASLGVENSAWTGRRFAFCGPTAARTPEGIRPISRAAARPGKWGTTGRGESFRVCAARDDSILARCYVPPVGAAALQNSRRSSRSRKALVLKRGKVPAGGFAKWTQQANDPADLLCFKTEEDAVGRHVRALQSERRQILFLRSVVGCGSYLGGAQVPVKLGMPG